MSRVDRILFDHIAIGMPKMVDAAPFLAGELGGVPDLGGPSGPYTWGTYRFEGGGSIEILEPLGEQHDDLAPFQPTGHVVMLSPLTLFGTAPLPSSP